MSLRGGCGVEYITHVVLDYVNEKKHPLFRICIPDEDIILLTLQNGPE